MAGKVSKSTCTRAGSTSSAKEEKQPDALGTGERKGCSRPCFEKGGEALTLSGWVVPWHTPTAQSEVLLLPQRTCAWKMQTKTPSSSPPSPEDIRMCRQPKTSIYSVAFSRESFFNPLQAESCCLVGQKA